LIFDKKLRLVTKLNLYCQTEDLKYLLYSNGMVFLTLNLKNNILIEFLSGNFLAFQNKYRIVPLYGYQERIIENSKGEEI
jgi:hypothetical protein